MSINATKLTLFAVISSVEEDLRALVCDICGHILIKDAADEQTATAVRDRMASSETPIVEPTCQQGSAFLDFADTFKIINKNSSLFPKEISDWISTETHCMELITGVRNRIAHSRPLEYDDFPLVTDFASRAVKQRSAFFRETSQCLVELERNPGFVLSLSIPDSWIANSDTINNNLPVPETDETGFIGRSKQVNDIVKLLSGPYPVISIIGEGGLGKTALALKVLYQIVDQKNTQFQHIVWSSSKTASLTVNEIKRIDKAISTSLGIFANIADEILDGDPPPSADAIIEEIHEYMSHNKMVIVLDNLETVLDEKIKAFLSNIPEGCKVLITSRIGVGAYEYPYKIGKMDEPECAKLARALARIRGVEPIHKANEGVLRQFCARLGCNPGFIKWFVSAVQSGIRPEDAMVNNSVFLVFCMDNVYNYLSHDSKVVIQVLQAIPTRLSQSEVQYLSNTSAIVTQKSLQQLLTTNLVNMISVQTGTSFETSYELTDQARKYLNAKKRIPPNEFDRIQRANRALSFSDSKTRQTKRHSPYSFEAINARTRSERIVAKFLSDGLAHARSGRFSKANESLEQAKSLAPEYYEVHRVEAVIRYFEENFNAALSSYQTAIELEPASSPLRFHYGGFLLRCMDDTQGCIDQLHIARKIDPDSLEVTMEIARCHTCLFQFPQAIEMIDTAFKKSQGATPWLLKKLHDISLTTYLRKAENAFSNRDYRTVIDAGSNFLTRYQSIPGSIIDEKMSDKCERLARLLSSVIGYISDEGIRAELKLLHGTICGVAGINATLEQVDRRNLIAGTIIRVPDGRDFGFILGCDGVEYFFHFRAVDDLDKIKGGMPNTGVSFLPAAGKLGPCTNRVYVE